MYDWVISWAAHKHAVVALFCLAFAESSFFPVPPDVLLIVMCVAAYQRWAYFAMVTSIGSVLGGMLGYGIGYGLRDSLGWWLLLWISKLVGIPALELQGMAHEYFVQYGAWAVGIAGFTPIPYKVFTITAGWFEMNFPTFVLASALSRSARFFVVAGLIGLTYKKYGDKITGFIDKYFNLLTIIFTVLLVGGFLILKILR
ncbi:DedA family protein [bacterium]|nr:DedA family protein [bacterium]